MKNITETEAYAELACARDSLGETYDRLYGFYRRTCQDETSEGRLLAVSVRNVQLQLNTIQQQISDMVTCYTGTHDTANKEG
ncbi:hypothetical protein [Mixta calida]|uniref:hypothetical protein n=1 Tax=Erwiniaceae TaxID=1903409 RepID=UPI002909733C|nr:hypothetical protein [Mixta calida]MDU4291118.1 hypothetical protein [Mixta calida]